MLIQFLIGFSLQAALTERDVGAIANVVMDSLLKPSTVLSMKAVQARGIRFDAARTDSAFRGRSDREITSERLRIHRPVQDGTNELLADCEQLGRKPCRALGDQVYVYLTPTSRASDNPRRMDVVLYVVWAGRPLTQGPERGRPLIVNGHTVTVERSAEGNWRIVRVGQTTTS